VPATIAINGIHFVINKPVPIMALAPNLTTRGSQFGYYQLRYPNI